MSLFFYGVCILGVVSGGLVLLVLYSLLVIAKRGDKRGDECLDQLELEMLKTHKYAPPRIRSEKSENLPVPATYDLYPGGETQSGSYPR
jgi:hypothetical protein